MLPGETLRQDDYFDSKRFRTAETFSPVAPVPTVYYWFACDSCTIFTLEDGQAIGDMMAKAPAIFATAGLVAGLLVSSPATADLSVGAEDVTTAVTQQLLSETKKQRVEFATADASDTRINITKQGDGWAFGTAVVVSARTSHESLPEGRLFLAESTKDGWNVSLDGTDSFTKMAKEAPVLSTTEQSTFTATESTLAPSVSTTSDSTINGETSAQSDVGIQVNTVAQLPWANGQTWSMTGGPHGWGGDAAPYSSIDFAGGDQVVRSIAGGTAYTLCQGWVRVFHGGNYSSDYYHLWNNINVNGASIATGAFLGNTGTDVTCGGAAYGRHVHMALRHNDAYVSMNDRSLSAWVFETGAAYGGYARHGSHRIAPGGSMYNYGILWGNQGIIDSNLNSSATVNARTGPGTNYAVAGSQKDGNIVTVSCSSNGTTHSGRYGSTSLWNKLSNGTWVTDAFMWTGANGPINGWC